MNWQHVVPQNDLNHAVAPTKATTAELPVGTRAKCRKCNRAIYVAGPDDGPESLKALMRLR